MDDNNEMAPSPQQPLNGQGVQRIPGLKNLQLRLGSWNVGSICGRGTEVSEELRKRKVDVCCLQEVRWRGQEARFVGVKGRRYKLWWSGNDVGTGGVGMMVKEELCEKVIEVRRRSDRVMAVLLTLEEVMMRVVCGYGPQSGRPGIEKEQFYNELSSDWDAYVQQVDELVLGFG